MRLLALAIPAALTVSAHADLAWTDADGQHLLTYCGRPVLQYNAETVAQPAGVDDAHARNAYIHPLWSPHGHVLTDDFPADHYHQRGVFLAWTKTGLGELHPDFWNLGSKTGRVVFRGLVERAADGQGARLVVDHEWQARDGEVWVPALYERWTVFVHPLRAAYVSPWVIDLTSEQQCAGERALVLPEYRYGGMAYRGSGDWIPRAESVRVVTSEGLGRVEANGTRARWCFMGGPVDGDFAGVTLMDHPDDPRFPNVLRVHPKVPYFGYMLPASGSYTLEPGRTYTFRYRLLAHPCAPTADALNCEWERFIQGR